jgi:hypothetical protein
MSDRVIVLGNEKARFILFSAGGVICRHRFPGAKPALRSISPQQKEWYKKRPYPLHREVDCPILSTISLLMARPRPVPP